MKSHLIPATLLWAAVSLPITGSAIADEVSLDGIVAVVNKNIILHSDLASAVTTYEQRVIQRGQQLPDDKSFQRQVLSLLIEQQVQLQHARSIGIRVGETELNRALRRIAEDNNQSLSEFRQSLTAEGRDYRQAREEVRTQMVIHRLRNQEVLDRVVVSQQEINDYLAKQAKSGQQQVEYTLQRILIGLPDGASSEEIATSSSQAQALVEQLRDGEDFTTLALQHSSASEALDGGYIGTMLLANMPSIYSEAIEGKDVGTISEPLRTANGFHIIRIADKSGSGQQQHMVGQAKVRHILLKINAIRDNNATRDQITQLRERALLGDDFADLALAHSEDSSSASAGGELAWLNPGDMPRAFDEALENLQPGQLSEPFRTPFGWHIVELVERREQDQTDTLLTAQAREAVRIRKAGEEEQLWRRRLRAEAYIEYRVAELAPTNNTLQ